MDTHEFLARAKLEVETLDAFIEAGWLLSGDDREQREFNELDVARVQLIHDLRLSFGVNDEGVAIVLHLIDQLHGMRQLLRNMLAAGGPRSAEALSAVDPNE